MSATIIGGSGRSQGSDLTIGGYGSQYGHISHGCLFILDGDRLDNLNGTVAIGIGHIPADGGCACREWIGQQLAIAADSVWSFH